MTNMNMNQIGNAIKDHISQAKLIDEFESYVTGADDAPVIVAVTHYFKQLPLWNADNPDDFYGYTEFDYEIYDLATGIYSSELQDACTERDTERFLMEYELGINEAIVADAEDRARDAYEARMEYGY